MKEHPRVDKWGESFQEEGGIGEDGQLESITELPNEYSDEIPPFDITVNFLNEYGQTAKLEIIGVEILNEGQGMSVDDMSTEQSCTFVARKIKHMKPDIVD